MTISRKPYTKPPRATLQRSSVALCTPAVMRPVGRDVARVMPVAHKAGRHESEAWRRAVASLECMRCGAVGATQCAHRNKGKGMGLKTDDALTAALCAACHSEIDQGKTMTRDERRAALDEAILRTVRELAVRGLIEAKRV